MAQGLEFNPEQLQAELQAQAPQLDGSKISLWEEYYPLSNDALAASFKQGTGHVAEAEDSQAGLRPVTLAIGEAALSESLTFMNDIVVLIDKSAMMCAYLQREYLPLLQAPGQTRQNFKTGIVQTIRRLNPRPGTVNSSVLPALRLRDEQWRLEKGQSVEEFEAEPLHADKKTIVVWHGDVRSSEDMHNLGTVMRNLGGQATQVDLSNMLSHDGRGQYQKLHTIEDLIRPLSQLPLARSTAFLATSAHAYDLDPERQAAQAATGYFLVPATGPFYGLEALRAAGEDTSVGHHLGQLAIRPRPQ